MNPRIVKGRPGSGTLFAARGRVETTAFLIGVDRESAARYPRLSVEDHLMAEAESLIARVENSDDFDWGAFGFRHNAEFEVWEKTLSQAELASVMGGAG